MQTNLEVGKLGEELAIKELKAKGYKIIKCNWRAGKNEIDIIALLNNITIFVEVKSRNTDNKGHPEHFVTKAKQTEIKKAAQVYLNTHETDLIRFDVIAITFWQNADTEIIHFEDAFF